MQFDSLTAGKFLASGGNVISLEIICIKHMFNIIEVFTHAMNLIARL
jgi:hypothetical protein